MLFNFLRLWIEAEIIFIKLLVIIEFYIWISFGWSWRLLHGSRSPAFFCFFLSHPLLSVCLMTWNRDYAIFCNWKLWDQVIIFPFKQFYVLMVIVIKETDSDYILFLLPFCLLFLVLLFFLVMSCSSIPLHVRSRKHKKPYSSCICFR